MSSMDVRAFERDVFFNFSTVSYYSKLKVTEKVQKEFVSYYTACSKKGLLP